MVGTVVVTGVGMITPLGASPREVKTVILNAAQSTRFACLTPEAVLEELRLLVQDGAAFYPYLRMEPKELAGHSFRFLKEALEYEIARQVALHLGIPYYVVNLEERFEREVVRPFIDEYLAGRTPIPCTLCNSFIKFDQFEKRIDDLEEKVGVLAEEIGRLVTFVRRSGLLERWPDLPAFAFLGRISYSLFLIHFPLVLLANAVFVRFGWITPTAAVFGILATWTASVAVAAAFHRHVEEPAGRLFASRPAKS